ncbi:DUF6174 domain-containing protein [Algicola sagamiensis]|uniref:DUF6174 domain-containing protein n=1 Tax=Algicola sagamiensis TaxID=163869 RepID=UPI0003637882|nr:DUF6174 domain-containing protein [Algicola sagamiensis]
MKVQTLAAAVALTIASTAVQAQNPDDFTPDFNPEVPQSLVKWFSKGLTDYSFQFTRYCFCQDSGVPYIVDVRDRKVARVKNTETGAYTDNQYFKTIDGLFVELVKHNGTAYKVEGSFNSRWGYPESVYVDIHPMMADEEISYRIDQFFAMMP